MEGLDAEAEAPILWPLDAKSWLIGKDPDAGKDWGQEQKGMTEDEMVGWHHWLVGHEFEQTLGDGGRGSLALCSWWGCKESDTTEQLNNNKSLFTKLCNETHHCHHFWVCNSVIWSTLTLLCNHYHCAFPELFVSSWLETLYPLN